MYDRVHGLSVAAVMLKIDIHGRDGWQVEISVVYEEWSKMICEHPKSLRHLAMLKVISNTEGEGKEKGGGSEK